MLSMVTLSIDNKEMMNKTISGIKCTCYDVDKGHSPPYITTMH